MALVFGKSLSTRMLSESLDKLDVQTLSRKGVFRHLVKATIFLCSGRSKFLGRCFLAVLAVGNCFGNAGHPSVGILTKVAF